MICIFDRQVQYISFCSDRLVVPQDCYLCHLGKYQLCCCLSRGCSAAENAPVSEGVSEIAAEMLEALGKSFLKALLRLDTRPTQL